MVRSVAIVGAGFSGLLTALHLLARPSGPVVSLIERGEGFGLGTAYGACRPEHLLNVRAGNMSAFPDQPDHFTAWLRREGGRSDVDGAAFASRRAYGAYLQQLLREAVAQGSAGRLELVQDGVTGIVREVGGLELQFSMGRTATVDVVVLAPGAAPATPPAEIDPVLLESAAYVGDPWTEGALDRIERDDPVLIIGAGLTMVDVAITLARRGPRRRIVALSRHGLLPQRHAGAPAPPAPRPPLDISLAESVRLVRARATIEGNWRAVFDSLRPVTQALWGRLTLDERQRFLRHLRPYWDTHRHRLAPEAADELDGLRAAGRLELAAGRLLSVQAADHGVEARWRSRGGGERSAGFRHVVNCTGPGSVRAWDDPLVRGLIGRGYARPDPLDVGLDVDAACRLLDARGTAAADLFVVGPLTRGAFWESTAVPDLRVQAAAVAQRIVDGANPPGR